MKEVIIEFNDGCSNYAIHIVKKLFQRQSVDVCKVKRMPNNLIPELYAGDIIKAKVSASTLRDHIEYWLINLNSYLVKKRRQKHCKA